MVESFPHESTGSGIHQAGLHQQRKMFIQTGATNWVGSAVLITYPVLYTMMYCRRLQHMTNRNYCSGILNPIHHRKLPIDTMDGQARPPVHYSLPRPAAPLIPTASNRKLHQNDNYHDHPSTSASTGAPSSVQHTPARSEPTPIFCPR